MKNNLFKNSICISKLLTKKLPIAIGIKQNIIMTCLLSMPLISNAQFVFIPGGGTSTAPLNNKVGIGNFPTTPAIQAKLHVNSFLLAPNVPTNGFLFRTDGDQFVVNQWQLFTGPTNLTTTEKFRLFVPATTNSVFFQQSQIGGIMGFNTGGAVTRMIIRDGFGFFNDGRIAMGNNLPANFLPQARLHLHQDIQNVFMRTTNNNTGITATDGFEFGINNNGIGFINQFETEPIDFNFQNPNTNILQNRFIINSGTYNVNNVPTNNLTRVGIWETGVINFAPNILAMLHLGVPAAPNTDGHRDWMNIGSYYNTNAQTAGTDNMYVGLRIFGQDQINAVINWGDNPQGSTPNTAVDRLTFIFTAPINQNLGQSSTQDGLEVGRMAVNLQSQSLIGWGGDPFTNLYFGGSIDPTNTVEINSFGNVNTPGGSSGLRFTDLNSTSPTIPNPGAGVLTVDANGDVIYVPTPIGGSGYFACNNPQANMTFNSKFNLNSFNFYFEGNGSGNTTDNSVIIGKVCATAPLGKLDVLQASTTTSTTGIYQENQDLSGGTPLTPVIGIKSFMPNNTDFYRIAGWFESPQLPGLTSCAIFVPQLGGQVSIGYPTPFFNTGGLLEVNGNIFMNGLLVQTSDQTYKTNITSITSALDKIMSLNGVYFYWDTLNYPNNNFSSRKQVGFIAQNVDSVLPEVVYTDFQGKKNLSYERIIALYAQALKELNNKVDSLSQSNSLRTNANSSTYNVTIDLSSDIVLYQNAPNPFGESTIIKYYLPANVVGAKMIFMDETGRIIKEQNLDQTGDGQITVNAQDLANGIYTYSLYVNGQNVQTRKMQKIK